MIKHVFPIYAGLIFAMVSGVEAQTIFQDKQEESLKVSFDKATEATVVEHTDVRYETLRFVVGLSGDKKDVIAKAQTKHVINYNREGRDSNIKVELYYFDSSKPAPVEKPDKTYEIPQADEVKFSNDVWEAITHGCCGAESYNRLYSYASDKPILRFNEKYRRIVLPNHDSGRRYVGVLLKSQTGLNALNAAFGENRDADFSVTYSSLAGKEQRAYFKLKKSDGMNTADLKIESIHKEDTIEEFDNSINVWSADKKLGDSPEDKKDAKSISESISGLTIKASFFLDDGGQQTISIPIEKDKLGKPEFNENLFEHLGNK